MYLLNVSLLLALLLSCGCASKQLYSWGQYEDTIYSSYSTPDKMPVARQIEILEADYQKARAADKSVPPGWHAHLGYLYYQTGNLDQAREHFRTEKALFPEATVLMDRMLKNLEKT